MKYLNEHLFPGQLGHFLAILSLVASLLATFSFFKAHKTVGLQENGSWFKLAKIAFAIETVSVIGIFACLYYIISHHLFEFKYAWQHSSKSLEVKYLLSCFWEGQEGSFMLWSFWHCILGWVIIWKSGKWAAPVMFVVSFAQVCLATMLLGIYFFGHKVGSSPFVLLRNELAAPIFSQPNYLSLLKDGQGLNALLQNYWMVIHPPILFLGFASTLVPFAFAMAGLMTKDHKGWSVPALPWALFSGAILGTGIMMGAAWAYESLTFGGYWAWDPVENASLVPWLVLISGIHTNLIFKSSGYSLRSTFLFYTLTFLLILYSTFLTRSGVLGDTSVHAFTDLGMNVQLYLFLGVFAWFSALVAAKTNKERGIYLLVFAALSTIGFWYPIATLFAVIGGIGVFIYQINKQVPTIVKEENTYSREFWMFIGSLIFFLSAVVVIIQTSLPVFNKMIGKKFAPSADPEFSYNQYQVFIALIIGMLTAVTQYLRYKDTPKNAFFKKLIIPTIIAAILTVVIGFVEPNLYSKQGPVFHYALYLATFASVYAVVANAGYIFTGIKGKMKLAGASIAHVGFGLALLGILISSSNRTVLSQDRLGITHNFMPSSERESPGESTTLIKGITADMGRYDVTYTRDTLNPSDGKTYFEILYVNKKSKETFNLYPDIIPNNKGGEGLTANPDSKHYWSKDIFTYITALPNPENKKDTAEFHPKLVMPGDTTGYGKGKWVFERVLFNPNVGKLHYTAQDTAFAAVITTYSKEGRKQTAMPAFEIHNNQLVSIPDTVSSEGLIFSLDKLVDPAKSSFQISVKESDSLLQFIALKVYEFPHINVLWIGIMISVLGFVMSIVRRVKLMRKDDKKA